MILNVLKLRQDELKITCILQGCFFIFAAIILALVVKFDSEPTTFEIGTMLSLFIILFMGIFLGSAMFERDFNIAISMGATRKKYIPAYYIVTLVITFIELSLVYVFHYVESLEIDYFYSNIIKETGVERFLLSIYVIPVVLLFSATIVLIGALRMKYGKKVYVAMWLLWMIICIAPQKINSLIESNSQNAVVVACKKVKDTLFSMSPVVVISIICILIIAFVAASVQILRKQQIENF